MKLENKRKAQARRAAQRKRQARIDMVKRYFWIPLLIVIIIGIAVAVISANQSDTTGETEAETNVSTETNEAVDTTEASEESSAELNTDTSQTVADGDTVNIDYIGYVDGVEFSGGNTEGAGADLEIGSDTYIDGFEDQIIGHNVGDTFDITVTFPDGYGDTTTVDGDTVTLDNQEAVFTVTVNGIYE